MLKASTPFEKARHADAQQVSSSLLRVHTLAQSKMLYNPVLMVSAKPPVPLVVAQEVHHWVLEVCKYSKEVCKFCFQVVT